MTRKEYNGWTNYETWSAALWFDNDGAVELFRERAQELGEMEDMETAEKIENLADYIKEFAEENNPLVDSASLYSQLLGAAMEEIEWYEIASHYFEE